MDEHGSTFNVPVLTNEPFFLPISGKHNILNTLAAMLAARELLVSPTSIKKGLKFVELSNMRMEWLNGIKGISILNDAYNASPTAMDAVICTFWKIWLETREKIVVLGDMLELGEIRKEVSSSKSVKN